jgi:tryptophanyl-tRNA synthetase
MEKKFKITPWEVEGKVEYDYLFKEFGVKKIDEKMKEQIKNRTHDLNYIFTRDIVFAHRDLDLVIQEGNFYLYTGRGPSGPTHLGHILSLELTKWLQDKFDCDVIIQLTDDEKFLEPKRKLKRDETEKWTRENLLDIASVGFNADRTFIFKNSEYIKNFYPLALKIAKRINYSVVKSVFGFTSETNIGLLFFPSLQIAPTFFENDKYCLIPAGIDQDPYFRLQRNVAKGLGYRKCASIYHKILPGLQGVDTKMSSSRSETAIYLFDDSPETIKNKIYKYAFSGGQPNVEEHRKKGGNPEIDVCFQWLYLLLEKNDKKIKEIEEDYRSGKLLTGELKNITIEKILELRNEYMKRITEAKRNLKKYMYTGKLARKMWETIHE